MIENRNDWMCSVLTNNLNLKDPIYVYVCMMTQYCFMHHHVCMFLKDWYFFPELFLDVSYFHGLIHCILTITKAIYNMSSPIIWRKTLSETTINSFFFTYNKANINPTWHLYNTLSIIHTQPLHSNRLMDAHSSHCLQDKSFVITLIVLNKHINHCWIDHASIFIS